MHSFRQLLLVAACVVLVGALLELRPSAAQTSAAQTGPAQIRVTARQISSASIDLGRPGASPGDMHISAAQVYNVRITQRPIGSWELVCTTVRGISRSCRGTLVLPRGTVVVAGTMRHRPLYQLAVVGGTGLYDNARGTITVTRLGTRPTRDLLLVRLLG
jgi:hypothetical protein